MAKELDISIVRAAVAQGNITWHKHALERVMERGLALSRVLEAINRGEVIESYPTDRPFPSALILLPEEKPIHVVVPVDEAVPECHVITAYYPSRERFGADF